ADAQNAAVRRQRSRQDIKQSGLAGTVGANDCKKLFGRNAQINRIQRLYLFRTVLVEAFGDMLKLYSHARRCLMAGIARQASTKTETISLRYTGSTPEDKAKARIIRKNIVPAITAARCQPRCLIPKDSSSISPRM